MRKLKTMDGNAAAAHVAYAFSEVAAIYPITPSSPMAENMDEWVSQDRTNVFGEQVKIIEMESEAGAAGAVHGTVITGSYKEVFVVSEEKNTAIAVKPRKAMNTLVIIFAVVCLACLMTWVIPAGEFSRVKLESGRFVVDNEIGRAHV